MPQALAELKQHLATIKALNEASALLNWDQRTYMPVGGTAARAEQLATLNRMAHEMFTAERTAELLGRVDANSLPPDSDDGRLLDVVRYDYERAQKLPAEFVARATRLRMLANPAWQQARADNTWSTFQPHLEALVALAREQASMLGYEEHPYDALLNQYERGLTLGQMRAVFDELKTGTLPLVQAIAASPGARESRDACLHNEFPERLQERFGLHVARCFGYDLTRGRQDRTVHPFCTNFGRDDVRITTRFNPQWLAPALFGTLHETGHALYEQGVRPALSRTPLERGASLGIHESQSRLWENIVGRSLGFWQHFYPELQATFPLQLREVPLEQFYRAINTVQPSLIRVEADELTYNLHIMLRFELEIALIEGSLKVADLPDAWNSTMQAYLGITPPTDREGVLQDIHWSGAQFGYFPTYTLGNVLSAQFYAAALEAHPAIPDEIAAGEFSTLLGWLQTNIYQHGRKFLPSELVRRVTGRPLDASPYLAYLHDKFSALYDLGAQA